MSSDDLDERTEKVDIEEAANLVGGKLTIEYFPYRGMVNIRGCIYMGIIMELVLVGILARAIKILVKH